MNAHLFVCGRFVLKLGPDCSRPFPISDAFRALYLREDEFCRHLKSRNYWGQTNSHREGNRDNVLGSFWAFNSARHDFLHRNY